MFRDWRSCEVGGKKIKNKNTPDVNKENNVVCAWWLLSQLRPLCFISQVVDH